MGGSLQSSSDPDSYDPHTILISRIADGDLAAFAGLFDQLAPKVLGLLVLILRSRSVAEEVLEDVFLQVWRQAAQYDPERGSVPSWIYTLTRSRGLDRLRQERSSSRREESLTEKAEASWTDQPRGATLNKA